MKERTRRFLAMLGIAVTVPLVVASLQAVRDRPDPKEVPPPMRVIACPQLRVAASDLPKSGWLGAAAATLACDRIRLRLGGPAVSALPPGALVPDGSAPTVFEQKDATARQREIANPRADAIVEGELGQGRDYNVTLRLVDRIGNELGKGTGAHVSLVGAIRMATDMLADEAHLATPPRALEPAFPGASLEAILQTHDLAVHALSGDAEELNDACEVLTPRSDLGSLAPTIKEVCDPWGGRPDYPAPTLDRSLRTLFFGAHPRGDLLWLPWQPLPTIHHQEADASRD